MTKYILLFVFFLNLFFFDSYSQSLSGGTGLVTIPTAFVPVDGEITLGAFYTDKKYLDYSDRAYNCLTSYVNFTFLPFLEVNLRIVRKLGFPSDQDYTVDRVPSIRLHLLKESAYLPAVCFGLHDVGAAFGGTEAIHFNSTYLVASKSFEFNGFINKVDLHAGYSSNLLSAKDYQFLGFFAGTSCTLKKCLKLMLEFDSRRLNVGTQLLLFKHIYLSAGLLRFDSFSGGVGCKFTL